MIAEVSLRQLQWWDEKQVVTPKVIGHSRCYSQNELLLVCLVSELRRKGISLQRIRIMLSTVRVPDQIPPYFVCNGRQGRFEEGLEDLLRRASESKHPCYLISLSDQIFKIRRFIQSRNIHRVLRPAVTTYRSEYVERAAAAI